MVSHRLRDTFAVDLLSKGVPMEEVSRLLGHTSTRTTEKSYAKWSKGRQAEWTRSSPPRGPDPTNMFIAEWSYWNSNQFGGSSCFAYDGRQVYCKCSLPRDLGNRPDGE